MSCTKPAWLGSILTTRRRTGSSSTDDGGPEHRAGEVGHATEDHHGDDREREGEAEQAGRGELSQTESQLRTIRPCADVMPNDRDLVAEHVLAVRPGGRRSSSRMPFSTRPYGDSPMRQQTAYDETTASASAGAASPTGSSMSSRTGSRPGWR